MIALSAGHHKDAKGAEWLGVYEFDITPEWVNGIAHELRNYEPVVIVPPGMLPSKIRFINSMKEAADLAVEIHFNSDLARSHEGSMTLYCPGSNIGRECAEIVQGVMGEIFKPDHGAIDGWYQGVRPPNKNAHPDAFLKETLPYALILEPEYIYNPKTIESKKLEAWPKLALAIHNAANHVRAK